MKRPFRDVPKESIELRLPIDIATIVRQKAAHERRSLSEVSSEIIVRGLGRDPAMYGIDVTILTG